MNRDQAMALISQTFTESFDKARFSTFVVNLLNHIDETKASSWNSPYIKEAFRSHVRRYERLGTYTSPLKEKIDILIVYLTADTKLERARTAIRNFVADHLKTRDEKDAALVAFVSPAEKQWRFSYVKMDYAAAMGDDGKVGIATHLTPAKRFSYLVGEGESCHTAQSRFVTLLQATSTSPTAAEVEEAFSVEAVTKEFFTQYAGLFTRVDVALDNLIKQDGLMRSEFKTRGIKAADFAKKLLGQIVFLYFLQKKGWLGVAEGEAWGSGPRDFLRRLIRKDYSGYNNFFDDLLEPLFYDALASDRGHTAWYEALSCRMPFLDGGLFEPLGGYDWVNTRIKLPNELFTNGLRFDGDIVGTGILDIFDRYNFTVNEAEPLEKDVAIDPEMLGKVFENLIEENLRKGLGTYYTPREIVHYMCEECLISYLTESLNRSGAVVPRSDCEIFVRRGEQISHYEAVEAKYAVKMPKSIEIHARLIDEKLADIRMCDPAVGSGAFPVGMMTEIVRARSALTPYFNDVVERTPYHFKRHAIQNSVYGVDIDPGAVEIAKLRLWLSLVVDEHETKQIKPLPNLDFKIITGDSLIGFPFKTQALDKIEKLKERFFGETDQTKKARFRSEIQEALEGCFARSKQSLGYKVDFDFEVVFSEVFHRSGGFDVVIANPPYGANIDSELKVLRPLYREAVQNYADVYKMFIQLGLRKLRANGVQSLITPNTFVAQPRYRDIRRVVLTNYRLERIVNLGENVFENVIVPTCLSFIARSEPQQSYLYADVSKNSKFTGDLNLIAFENVELSAVLSSPDVSLYPQRERSENEVSFEQALEIRDAGIQYHRSGIGLKNKGGNDLYERLFSERPSRFSNSKEVWYGKLIDRWWMADKTDEFFNLNYKRVLKANESATFNVDVFETAPRIIWRQTASCLRATIDSRKRWFRNTIQCAFIREEYRDQIDILYLLGIINSRYIEEQYNAIVRESGRAFPQVKLTHVKKLPLVIAPSDKQEEIAKLVEAIMTRKKRDRLADTSAEEIEINRLVDGLYGVDRAPALLV